MIRVMVGLERKFEISPRQKAIIKCLQFDHAYNFIVAIPVNDFGQRMAPVEYQALLQYCLIIALYKDGDHCFVCKK